MWIGLRNMPQEYWLEKCYREIGNKLGTYIKAVEIVDNVTLQNFPRVCIMWKDCHPIPEMVQLFFDGDVWRQPVSIEEGLKVCEFYLCEEHKFDEYKKRYVRKIRRRKNFLEGQQRQQEN